MNTHLIADGVTALPCRDADRRLFDELIPLPDGTSYNSFVVNGGEKTMLIDTCDPSKERGFIEALESLRLEHLDYIVANHAEQDHSGCIPAVLSLHPGATVLTTAKGKDFLAHLLPVREDRISVVTGEQRVSLGTKTIEFISAPWVHWPETMLTYLVEDAVLFPCDLFGSHLATGDLYADDKPRVIEAAKRYYAEIMMPFRPVIRTYLDDITHRRPAVIAPSHGPLHRDPAVILDAYRTWTSDEVSNSVLIPYISMHGSVARMVEVLTDLLEERGIPVSPFMLTRTDLGQLAIALVDAATVVFGSPTVLGGPHPAVQQAAYLAGALRPKCRFASIIGSFGWGGAMVERLSALLSGLKVEILSPVLAKGYPRENDIAQLRRLADEIADRHRSIGIMKTGG